MRAELLWLGDRLNGARTGMSIRVACDGATRDCNLCVSYNYHIYPAEAGGTWKASDWKAGSERRHWNTRSQPSSFHRHAIAWWGFSEAILCKVMAPLLFIILTVPFHQVA